MVEDYMQSDVPKKPPTVTGQSNTPQQMKGYQYDAAATTTGQEGEMERLHPVEDKGDKGLDSEISRYLVLRVLHSVMAGVNYGIALLLMLIAMTFNPALFLALVVGYTIGDFVFFARMRPLSSAGDCH